jgi:hypothetical protein
MATRVLSLSFFFLLLASSAFPQPTLKAPLTPPSDSSDLRQPLLPRAPQHGLRVSISDDGHVTGSFTKGKSTLYFEAIRGEAIDSAEPDAAPFTLDINVQDDSHTPFLIQGHGPTPATKAYYENLVTSQATPVDEGVRRRAFALLPAAVVALTDYTEEHDLNAWEIRQIIALMNSVTLSDIEDADTEASSSSSRIAPSAIATYKHVVTIKRKAAFDIKWELEHSALLLAIYNSKGSLLSQTSTCNHGACATSSSMTTKCTSTFLKPYLTIYAWDLMCDGFGYWYGGHTCNTDTRQEYLSIKGSSSQNWGICSVKYLYAPSCD